MSRHSHLGADIGGTGARWSLADDTGRITASGAAPAASGAAFRTDSRTALAATLRQIATEAHSAGTAHAMAGRAVIGLTGAGIAPPPELQAFCSQALGLRPAQVRVVSDIALAHAAVFGGGAGQVVLAGTGSAGLSRDISGRFALIGGYALPGGDPGSAAAVTLAAIAALCRTSDRCGEPLPLSPLGAALADATGCNTSREIAAWARAADRGALGLAARAVATAADAGDRTASNCLREAGAALGLMAETLALRCGPAPLVIAGRCAALHPTLRAGLRAALDNARSSRLSVSEPRFEYGPFADAAARVAAAWAQGTLSWTLAPYREMPVAQPKEARNAD